MTSFSPRFHLAGTAPGRPVADDAPVLVALAGPGAMRTLVSHIGHPARVFVGSRAQLVAAVREAPPVVLVLPAEGHDGMATAGLVAQLRLEVPRVAIVVVSDGVLHGRHARALRAAGARVIATAEHAAAAVATALDSDGISTAAELDASMQRALAAVRDPALRGLLEEAVRLPPAALTPLMLSELMGLRYRTFCRQCTESGWPSPGRLVILARLLRLSIAPAWRPSARAAFAGFRSSRAARTTLLRVMPALREDEVPAPIDLLRAAGIAD